MVWGVTTHPANNRSLLAPRIALMALSGIPLVTGALGVVIGAAGLPEPAALAATADSEYRFLNVFWFAAGVGLLWASFRLRERRGVAVTLLAVASAGGLARAWSVVVSGWPHPIYIGVMVLELIVVPAVIVWILRVTRGSVASPSSAPE